MDKHSFWPEIVNEHHFNLLLEHFHHMPKFIDWSVLPFIFEICSYKAKKSNLYYTRAIMPSRVSAGGVHHLRSLAPGQRSSEETLW